MANRSQHEAAKKTADEAQEQQPLNGADEDGTSSAPQTQHNARRGEHKRVPLQSDATTTIAETRARSNAHNAHASDNGTQHSKSQHPATATSAEDAQPLADSGERSDGQRIEAGKRAGSNTVGELSADRRTEPDNDPVHGQQEREADRRKQKKLLELALDEGVRATPRAPHRKGDNKSNADLGWLGSIARERLRLGALALSYELVMAPPTVLPALPTRSTKPFSDYAKQSPRRRAKRTIPCTRHRAPLDFTTDDNCTSFSTATESLHKDTDHNCNSFSTASASPHKDTENTSDDHGST